MSSEPPSQPKNHKDLHLCFLAASILLEPVEGLDSAPGAAVGHVDVPVLGLVLIHSLVPQSTAYSNFAKCFCIARCSRGGLSISSWCGKNFRQAGQAG